MDDWKLKTTPVVRIERPNKTFVQFVCSFVRFGRSIASIDDTVQLIPHSNVHAATLQACDVEMNSKVAENHLE